MLLAYPRIMPMNAPGNVAIQVIGFAAFAFQLQGRMINAMAFMHDCSQVALQDGGLAEGNIVDDDMGRQHPKTA